MKLINQCYVYARVDKKYPGKGTDALVFQYNGVVVITQMNLFLIPTHSYHILKRFHRKL